MKVLALKKYKKLNPKYLKLAATAFIIFHFLAIPASSSRPRVELSWYQKIFAPYLEWTRLRQRWPLFVPEPRRYSQKYYAEVYYKNGTKRIWQRPYPPNWDFFSRHLSYNWQKLDLAANNLEKRIVWPDFAKYIERVNQVDNVPITRIDFIRSKAQRPPPNETGYVQHDDSELVWEAETVFSYYPESQRLE